MLCTGRSALGLTNVPSPWLSPTETLTTAKANWLQVGYISRMGKATKNSSPVGSLLRSYGNTFRGASSLGDWTIAISLSNLATRRLIFQYVAISFVVLVQERVDLMI